MAAKEIGYIDCHSCGFHGVLLKEDKKGNPTYWCDGCSSQHQSRGGKSAKSWRDSVYQNYDENKSEIENEAGLINNAKGKTNGIDEKPKSKTFAEVMGL